MRIHVIILILGLFTGLLLLMTGCDGFRPEPIRIGFVAGLTGRTAAVGTAARDGAQLAVEQINLAGGIDGRQVDLIIRDIQQDPVVGLHAVEELVAAKVPVIIGPMTSTMALVLVPVVNGSETLMISPTAATRLLGEKDDNFIRLRPQCKVIAAKLANYVFDERNVRKVAVIYDSGNAAYTTDWKNCFAKRLESKGGEIVADIAFDSLGQHRFFDLVRQALQQEPEGILVLASSLDTALLTQQMMKLGAKQPVFASEWSMTRDLLSAGGRSVEGLAMFHVFNEASQKQKYLDFKMKYETRFRQEISFPLVHAYDATQVVLAGLKKGARTGPELKKILLQQESFDTLQSTVSFDRYGEVERELFLTTIRNGKFVVEQ